MSKITNIAIVGAGLIGRLLAYQLSKSSFNITLYEADSLSDNNCQLATAAAFTAAGMIAPISEAIDADIDTFHLGETSLSLWPQIIQQLEKETACDINYQQRGSLIISHPQDMAELTHFKRQIDLLTTKCNAAYRSLNACDIRAIEPNVSDVFGSGLFLENEADIDNRQLMRALLSQIKKQKVKIKDKHKVLIENNKVLFKQGHDSFDLVFDCRGTGAKEQVKGIRGVRGEVLRVSCPEVKITRPVRLMHPRYQLYLVPKPDQQYVIGATQIESEDRSPVSIQSMLELSSAIYSINPAFSEARILEQNTNLRPAFADNNARIIIKDKHVVVNGLFRHGYLIAPAITDTLINWLNGVQSEHFSTLNTQ